MRYELTKALNKYQAINLDYDTATEEKVRARLSEDTTPEQKKTCRQILDACDRLRPLVSTARPDETQNDFQIGRKEIKEIHERVYLVPWAYFVDLYRQLQREKRSDSPQISSLTITLLDGYAGSLAHEVAAQISKKYAWGDKGEKDSLAERARAIIEAIENTAYQPEEGFGYLYTTAANTKSDSVGRSCFDALTPRQQKVYRIMKVVEQILSEEYEPPPAKLKEWTAGTIYWTIYYLQEEDKISTSSYDIFEDAYKQLDLARPFIEVKRLARKARRGFPPRDVGYEMNSATLDEAYRCLKNLTQHSRYEENEGDPEGDRDDDVVGPDKLPPGSNDSSEDASEDPWADFATCVFNKGSVNHATAYLIFLQLKGKHGYKWSEIAAMLATAPDTEYAEGGLLQALQDLNALIKKAGVSIDPLTPEQIRTLFANRTLNDNALGGYFHTLKRRFEECTALLGVNG